MVTRAVLIAALVACACQGGGPDASSTGAGTASAAPHGRDAGGLGERPAPEDAQAIIVADDARGKPDEPELTDPGKVISELNAIPAWQAVVDRAQLLGRRQQHGVAYGRVGPAITMPGPMPEPGDAGVTLDAGTIASPYVWLVDDTEGNGTLGIRVKLDGRTAKEGDRVALGGAWELDADRRWYWRVDSVEPLPPAPPSDLKDPVAPAPTHVIASGGMVSGARMISVAKDGDLVYFQLVGQPPPNDGDGWPVADALGNPIFALINLPGERASYGGQDMRAPDERWQLKRGQTYWVRIGKIRKRGVDKPAVVHARTAPVRVL